MIVGVPLAKDILSRPAQVLLLGTFGVSLILTIRRGENLSIPFERLAIGFFAILFYSDALQILFRLGTELDEFFSQLGDQNGLKDFVAHSLYQAATQYGPGTGSSALNLENYLMQILRTGVWGVLSSATELVFLLARFLLEVSRDALWQILFILFPLTASAFPVYPKMLASFSLVALELCLWVPVLTIVNVATSLLTRAYTINPNDIGFHALACEVVAIILTLSIPSFVHRMLTGSLTGDVLGPWTRALTIAAAAASHGNTITRTSQKIFSTTSDYIRRHRRGASIILFFLLPTLAHADVIEIPFGYITKVSCEGRLLISAVGDERILEISALPKELGCGALLKPRVPQGKTNLLLETSTGSINQVFEVSKNAKNLSLNLRASK